MRPVIRVFLVAASLVLGALLLLGLILTAKIDIGEVLSTLKSASPVMVILFVLCSAALIGLSAAKWSLISRQLAGQRLATVSPVFFFSYTCLGSALSLLMPVHLSAMTARSIGLRFQHQVPVARGISTSVFEQIFDVLLPAAMAGPAFMFMIGFTSPGGFVLFSGMAVLTLGAAIIGGGAVFARWTRRLFESRLKRTGWIAVLVLGICNIIQQVDRRLLGQLYVLSLARFAVLLAQASLALWVTRLAISALDIVAALPLVQLSFLVAVTPASIGVAEWTWSSLLFVLGVSLPVAAAFAITYRLMEVGAILLIATFTAIFNLTSWTIRRRQVGAPSA